MSCGKCDCCDCGPEVLSIAEQHDKMMFDEGFEITLDSAEYWVPNAAFHYELGIQMPDSRVAMVIGWYESNPPSPMVIEYMSMEEYRSKTGQYSYVVALPRSE